MIGSGTPKKSWAQIAKAADKPGSTTPVEPSPKSSSPPPKPKVTPEPVSKPKGSTKVATSCPLETPMERGYPLGFASKAQFEECMGELRDAVESAGIDCEEMGVRGSAATYRSENPNKKGQFFDSRGKGKSDIDVFFVTDTRLKDRPSKEGFFHPDKIGPQYPAIQEWNKKWSKTLGRDITAAAMKSDSPKLAETFLPSGK